MPKFKNREEYEKWKTVRANNLENMNDVFVQPVNKTNKIIKIYIAICLLIVSLSIAYYFVDYLPANHYQEQMSRQQKERDAKEREEEVRKEEEAERKKREQELAYQNQIEQERRESIQREKEELIRQQTREAEAKALAAEVKTRAVNNEILNQNNRRTNLYKCLDDASKSYNDMWDRTCRKRNCDDRWLPRDDAKFLDERHEKSKADCYKLYDR